MLIKCKFEIEITMSLKCIQNNEIIILQVTQNSVKPISTANTVNHELGK
jgi:hypothetical protein